ncbi:hypothetical protein K469DRAFT_692867 [Zopfia rhizophila CBS 207.26]|uniref:Uncharacterized protein n=1 Tax=Zopfia rhizophila CBS 207.26 TaxID=1314779 RepID=A0A6A6DLG7_9PEZI|nr:hypothetical protein K469DRAFT_692867 [Zopfia rhizophila CBS 207.26]
MVQDSHHCLECNDTATRRSYHNLHWGFCVAPATLKDGSKPICGERFAVDSSGGCFQHPYNHGFNIIYKEARRGKDLTSAFKGNGTENEDASNTRADPNDRLHRTDDPEDLEPWKKYTQTPEFKVKAPPRPRKAHTSKLQPAKGAKAFFTEKKGRTGGEQNTSGGG